MGKCTIQSIDNDSCRFKVRDRHTKEILALKVMSISNDEEGISPVLIREISILRELQHPNIVKYGWNRIIMIRLQSVVMDNSEVKLYFEYLDYDLKNYSERFRDGIPRETIKTIMYQLLCGLNYLHLNRFIHRDIKPQNILIDNKRVVKIADFGLARSFAFPLRHYTRDVPHCICFHCRLLPGGIELLNSLWVVQIIPQQSTFGLWDVCLRNLLTDSLFSLKTVKSVHYSPSSSRTSSIISYLES